MGDGKFAELGCYDPVPPDPFLLQNTVYLICDSELCNADEVDLSEPDADNSSNNLKISYFYGIFLIAMTKVFL